MKKDEKMLMEAYISAVQKGINIPSDVTDSIPDTDSAVEMHAEPAVVTSITSEEPDTSSEHYQEEEKEETSMAAANLFSIFTDAKMLHELLQNGEHLDTWMLQKIAVVADNLSSVSKVAKYHFAKGGE
jgi:hypothetical protein